MIVLTGATGDLGGLVASKLLEKGFCVRLSSTSKKALEKRFGKSEKNRKELFELDFEKNCDFEELTKNADVVIHLAGQMTRHLPLNDARAIPSRIVNVNFKATKHLVESAKKSGVEKIVFSSSCSVYGKKHDSTDSMAASPFEAYGLSKLLAEQALQKSGLSYAILRIARIYGKNFPNQFAHEVNALKKKNFVLPDSGNGIIPIVHQNDVANAVLLALECKKNVVADISGPEKSSYNDFYKKVAKRLGVCPPAKAGSKILESCVLSNKKAQDALKWKPKEFLSDHLDEICFNDPTEPLFSKNRDRNKVKIFG